MTITKSLLLAVAWVLPAVAAAQDYIESFSHNENFRGSERVMQYQPTGDGYLRCKNGKNLYTKALYGSHTLWRLETSDVPIFGAYHKKDNRNIHFTVSTPYGSVRLDSASTCISDYRGAERAYFLQDKAFGDGAIEMTVVADAISEAAYWKIEAVGLPKGSTITAASCATVAVKLNRSGDMGADPANCFAPDPERKCLTECTLPIKGKKDILYFEYADGAVNDKPQKKIRSYFDQAMADKEALVSGLRISTPDPYLNILGSALSVAGDAIWDGETYLHGAIGWRMPLSGWRGAYTGDFLGSHDRARSHFNAYAASQVTDVEPVIPHPAQDSTMCIARAEKKWGTQMYSNGYICRNPNKNNVMHHYDMDLCYIDELLWHLQWTGDTAYAREIWPVLKSALEWEKRNFDPDGDHLYDAYCCIWASDALYYNSGAVTHSSAYNHRANKVAAKVAEMIGEDPTPYNNEADAILKAMNETLWLPDKGVWAEFKDFMGHKSLHTHPGLWTIYHAIDSETASPGQAYSATRYIDGNIPHIPVQGRGVNDSLYTLSTTDWLPYAWSINNVAFAEVYHTALAYWLAGRPDEATRLLKGAVIDGMYLGNSPGNIGQVSHYDAARGESYRDFADPVGVLSRAVVQGLFGFTPQLLDRKIIIRPGFPLDWEFASINHPDFMIEYTGHPDVDINKYMSCAPANRLDVYRLWINPDMASGADSLELVLPDRYPDALVVADGLIVDGVRHTDTDTPYATMRCALPVKTDGIMDVLVIWSGRENQLVATDRPVRYAEIPEVTGLELVTSESGSYRPVDLADYFNADVKDIFNNKYLSPRSPYTTLQIPVQGIGEWCHPKDTAVIDDTALRASGGVFNTPQGIPFATPAQGNNIIYTSLFDNYPDSVTVPLEGCGSALALMLAGSANHMQCYMKNAVVEVKYADGSIETLDLVMPYNWAPIEQDYFIDGKAFAVPSRRPVRVALKGGEVSDNLGDVLGIEGVYGRRIDGGAGIILCLPLDRQKPLASMTLKTLSNEIVVGLISVTIVE